MLPFIILGAINTYIFLNTGKIPKGTWTVYGTTSVSYTHLTLPTTPYV